MNEAFVPVVMQAFDDAKTNYLKGGPSHTSKTQDWDCGPLFRSLKIGIAMIVKHNISVAKATLRTNLIAACVQFSAETNINLGTLQEKIIHAHLMVVHATQKYWTADGMRTSSQIVGLHREEQEEGESTVNYDRVMTRTLNTSTTAAELMLMRASVLIVAAEFKDQGNCALAAYWLLQVLYLVQIVCRY